MNSLARPESRVMVERRAPATALPEEKTKQSPAEANCVILGGLLVAMKAERDAALDGKLKALDERDVIKKDRDRWRRRFYNLLVALLMIGAIGVGACISQAARVVR